MAQERKKRQTLRTGESPDSEAPTIPSFPRLKKSTEDFFDNEKFLEETVCIGEEDIYKFQEEPPPDTKKADYFAETKRNVNKEKIYLDRLLAEYLSSD